MSKFSKPLAVLRLGERAATLQGSALATAPHCFTLLEFGVLSQVKNRGLVRGKRVFSVARIIF